VTGDIYRGNLQTGTGEVLVHAPAGSSAVGLKADDADHLLFVCEGLTGTAHVCNSRTGALVAQYQFAPNGASLINDVVLTAHAATADGNTLIVDNTVLDKLFTVNPITGASAPINVAGLIPNSLDGLRLEGSSLWIVENTANTVIRVTLSHDLSSGTITSTITSPLFDDPTTAAKYGDELALPNGRYDLGLPPPFGPGAPQGPPSTWSWYQRTNSHVAHSRSRPARDRRRESWSVLGWLGGGEKVGEQLVDALVLVVMDPVRGVGQALDAVEVGHVVVLGLG
jgi:hypothetical protein